MQQRVGGGTERHALGRQRPDVLGRHVLVVEGDHVAALGEGAQRGEVGVVAVLDVGGDQRGAVVGGEREHAQRLAEGDRGLVGHPGQLAAATMPTTGRPVRESIAAASLSAAPT